MSDAAPPAPRPRAALPEFRPLWWASGPVAQTALAQLPFRTVGQNEMVRAARAEIVRVSGGVSVQGHYSAQVGRPPRGLVLMLSGWEGHADSPYMLRMGRRLFLDGYEIFRLTYPDHGGTHDLNEGAFHFGMLDKIEEAIHRICSAIRTRPVYLLGFSMGGNVTLNLACRGLPGLRAAFAISPALDFSRAITALQASFFHSFFLSSWKTSLEKKQALFPHRHDFSGIQHAESVGEIATSLVTRQTGNQSFTEYTARYSLPPSKLLRLTVPAHLLAAVDDPIVGPIPYEQYRDLPKLSLHLARHGGHVGFLGSLFGPAYYEQVIPELFREHALQPLKLG